MSTLQQDVPLQTRIGARNITKSVLLELMKSREWSTLAVERMISWGDADKLPLARRSSFQEWLETDEQGLVECTRVLAAVLEAAVEKPSEPGSALPPDLKQGNPASLQTREEPYTPARSYSEVAEGEKKNATTLQLRLKEAIFMAVSASFIEEAIADPDKGPKILEAFEAQVRRIRSVVGANADKANVGKANVVDESETNETE